MRWIIPVLLVTSLVGCDHATKRIATSTLDGKAAVPIIADVLDLTYAQNFDVGFGLLRWIPQDVRTESIIVLDTALIFLLVVILILRRSSGRLERAALLLLLSGAIGNLLDRVLNGYVVDFIHLHRWPVFNVADVLIVGGVALLAIELWRQRKAGSSTGPTVATR